MPDDLKSPASDATLTPINFEGMTVYRDAETGGHWLPRGQMQVLAEEQLDHELPPLLEIDETTMHHSGRFCPEDGLEMVEYEFADSGIKVEQCLSCQGVWLDAGELKKLMAYVHQNSEDIADELEVTEDGDEELSVSTRVLAFLYRLTARPPYV
jgi:Zn-finger nucleic acid-binding protein